MKAPTSKRYPIEIDPSTLVTDGARGLLTHWQETANASETGVPDSAYLSPFNLKPWLSHLAIYRRTPDGTDFVNRLDGTGIVQITGEDWTGHPISAIDARYGTRVQTFLEQACERRQSIALHSIVFRKDFIQCESVVLPVMSTSTSEIVKLGFGLFPIQRSS